jgi:site-specific DNA-methyltransferase (adenine-specific)/adenine-specific DNA-methyltransferase
MSKQNDIQTISPIKGRPMLQWIGKKPLESIEYFPAQEKEVYGDLNAKEFNKLFWGDNLQVLSHLLKEYRGKIDLIYIDPPFDSKADYIKKVKVKGEKMEGQQKSLLEEKQYTDIWENDEYLQFMYERLQILKELMSENANIYIHLDYRRVSELRLIMDEIFGKENFLNEISWYYRRWNIEGRIFARNHDNILLYAKNLKKYTFNQLFIPKSEKSSAQGKAWKSVIGDDGIRRSIQTDEPTKGVPMPDAWEISMINPVGNERVDYPTQKPEALLERIINASSNPGDLVLDCFCGSGTTLGVAQKLGRRWIGCDINLGAIQTTTKRLNQIVEDQKQQKLTEEFKGLRSFKVYNVNDYDIFKNEVESKEIIMEIYGVEPIKQSYFDGVLDDNLVKVMPLNRVLNKLDIENVIKEIERSIDQFTGKTTSSQDEETYEQEVIVIASGVELDALEYLRKENKTGVKVEVRDIQADKKNLIFKQLPEAKIEVKADEKKVVIEIKDFHSPILIKKLELENEKQLNSKGNVYVEDFKQIIDSVCIDTNYNGKLFNAEIMDLPEKKSLISAKYEYEYKGSGKNIVAVKIIDVLGEEYFETFEINIK